MNCSKITAGLIASECGKSATAGLEDDMILINFDDIDRSKSEVTDNVITKLILKGGAKAFLFTTFGRSFNEAGGTFSKGTYRNFWSHSVPLRIFTKSETSKAFVNSLTSGAKLVALGKNKEIGKAGDVKYEAYGWDNGLELGTGASAVSMADGVVYDLTMSSADEAQEGSLPKSVFAVDLVATETMINGLTA